ncbi:type II toxin-antitoxin system PemK/MazF family toxin [Vibrio sp. 2art]|uniref:type II toxin-antitoxin system PemK/MazF family toxin n=1 Tax=Vibrio sp. 2art TaxID=2998832 RepID=UPI0022CDA0D0|nr:type II toxin-antitoxin system PemK/MazF family toxin [Vibrio sp. 2art]MDA0114669.1 type II toxin-antitoxin system PemK/MazF family toxin [Vibrio sp. 2art]
MMKMRTTYYLYGTTDELGREECQGITEVLFPDINYEKNSHVMTITKMFVGQPHCRWQVKSVEHPKDDEINVYLEPRIPSEPEVFLSQTHKVKRSVISQLRKGTLVEVDYGYIPSVKKSSGDTKSNKRYPDSRQSGEMHKRRLAIVVKASGNRVQIVPVSSSIPPAGDRACFELDRASLEKLIHYNDENKQSFAICSMIETISLTRILPPLAKPIKKVGRQAAQRSDGYPHKLSKIDLKALDKALSVIVGISDYQEIKEKNSELYLSNSALKKSEAALQVKCEAFEAEIVKAQESLRDRDALWNMVEVHFRQLNPTKSEKEISAMIRSELEEWIMIADNS